MLFILNQADFTPGLEMLSSLLDSEISIGKSFRVNKNGKKLAYQLGTEATPEIDRENILYEHLLWHSEAVLGKQVPIPFNFSR